MDRHDMNFIDIDRYIPATVCSQYPSSISHNARATMTPCLEHTLSYAAMSIILSCIWARLISRIQTPALVQFTSHITTTLGLLIMIFAMASSASATASPSSVLVDPPSVHAPSHPARFVWRVLPSSTALASASPCRRLLRLLYIQAPCNLLIAANGRGKPRGEVTGT